MSNLFIENDFFKVWNYFKEQGVTTMPLTEYTGVKNDGKMENGVWIEKDPPKCSYYKRPILDGWSQLPVDHWSEEDVQKYSLKEHGIGVICDGTGRLTIVDVDNIISGGTMHDFIEYVEKTGLPAVFSKKGIHIYGVSDIIGGSYVIDIGTFTISGEIRATGSGHCATVGTKWGATDHEMQEYGITTKEGKYTGNRVFMNMLDTCVSMPEIGDYIVIHRNKGINSKNEIGLKVKEVNRRIISKYLSIRIFENVNDKSGGYRYKEGSDMIGRHDSLSKICKEIRDKCIKDGLSGENLYDTVFSAMLIVRDRCCQNAGDKDDKEIENIVTYFVGKKLEWETWVSEVDWSKGDELLQDESYDDFQKNYIQGVLLKKEKVENEIQIIQKNQNGLFYVEDSLVWSEYKKTRSSFSGFFEEKYPYIFFSEAEKCYWSYNPNSGCYTKIESQGLIEAIIHDELILASDSDVFKLRAINKSTPWVDIRKEWSLSTQKKRMGARLGQGSNVPDKTYLFPFSNGVMNLDNNCTMLPHSPIYEFEGNPAIEYDASVIDSDLWQDWHEIIMDFVDQDEDKYNFIQMMLGYSMTASTELNALFIIHGVGGSGKSTLFSAMLKVLGNMGVAKKIQELDKKQDNSAFEILRGKRAVLEDDVTNQRISTSFIKSFTTGAAFTSRQLYGTESSFTPTAKLWILANEYPSFTSVDDALLDRIFTCEITTKVRGTDRQKTRFKDFIEGKNMQRVIAVWGIEGFKKLRATEMRIPALRGRQGSLEALAIQSDSLKAFIYDEDYIKVNRAYKNVHGYHNEENEWWTEAKIVFSIYEKWCTDNRIEQRYRTTLQKFYSRLSAMGYVKVKSSRAGGKWFIVGLKVVYDSNNTYI